MTKASTPKMTAPRTAVDAEFTGQMYQRGRNIPADPPAATASNVTIARLQTAPANQSTSPAASATMQPMISAVPIDCGRMGRKGLEPWC